MMLRLLLGSSLLVACLTSISEVPTTHAADSADVRYFRVHIAIPKDFALPSLSPANLNPIERDRRRLQQLPRLRGLDGVGQIYFDPTSLKNPDEESWIFLGRYTGKRPTKFELTYPTTTKKTGLAGLLGDATMKVIPVEPEPVKEKRNPRNDSFAQAWKAAYLFHLGTLEARIPEVGLYRLAREVFQPNIEPLMKDPLPSRRNWTSGMYELTTGADALTESLALGRLSIKMGAKAQRVRNVNDLRGIDIAEHPWVKMMAGRKPEPEPLARLVPANNWYFTAHTLAAYLEAVDLIERWGGNVLSTISLHDRDYDIRGRYERQLCLPTKELQNRLPKDLVTDLALTGSDLAFQEGTDITVLFQTNDPEKFVKLHNRLIIEASKDQGADWSREKETYASRTIEIFKTRLREVSLYRAVMGKVVVCSNSPAGLRKVMDRFMDERSCLADSLDFQYMRTVFRRDAKEEDGFVFLSDAFIRQLVGPSVRIRQARRMEARSTLTLLSNAAVVAGWENRKLPALQSDLLKNCPLPQHALDLPEGKPARWDSVSGQAVSDVYNSLSFLTPLAELPIDNVTQEEATSYETFREGYMRLWRRFFDPVGIRFQLKDKQVKVDTYILPLINSSRYNNLRNFGLQKSPTDPNRLTSTGAWRFQLNGPINEWFAFNMLTNGPITMELADWLILRDVNPEKAEKTYGELFWKLPFAMELRTEQTSPSEFLSKAWESHLKGGETTTRKYRQVEIRRRPIDAKRWLELVKLIHAVSAGTTDEDANWILGALQMLPKDKAPEALYAADVEKVFLLGFNEETLKRRIDTVLALKAAKPTGEELNATMQFRFDGEAGEALKKQLEWQTHLRAQRSLALWEGLRRAGIAPTQKEIVRRLLGYVPSSPDGTKYIVDRKQDEIRNERHGSLARPICHDRIKTDSGLAQLLNTLKTVNIQFRFKEDGIHTTVLMDRTGR